MSGSSIEYRPGAFNAAVLLSSRYLPGTRTSPLLFHLSSHNTVAITLCSLPRSLSHWHQQKRKLTRASSAFSALSCSPTSWPTSKQHWCRRVRVPLTILIGGLIRKPFIKSVQNASQSRPHLLVSICLHYHELIRISVKISWYLLSLIRFSLHDKVIMNYRVTHLCTYFEVL